MSRLRHPIDHPATADFVAGLAPVNALAMCRSQGFQPCSCWGEYASEPLSRCFSRLLDLTSEGPANHPLVPCVPSDVPREGGDP